MSISNEIQKQFLAGKRTDQVRFVKNDSVLVTAGSNKKRTGIVLSIFSLEPVTTYLIEPAMEPWGDFQAAESVLERIEP